MYFFFGAVAQLARAFGSYPKGRGFKSLRRYQMDYTRDFIFRVLYYIAPWPSGKASDSDSEIVSSNLTGAAN